MLKKILKWMGIFIGSLAILLLIFYAIAYFNVESRANKIYSFKKQKLIIPDDSASYELGKHIAAIKACNDCHGGGGKVLFDENMPILNLNSPNITSGKGGIDYTDEDWVTTLRHGINKEGKSLWFMPVKETTASLSNKELAALICYMKKQPPVDKTNPKKEIKPLGRILSFLNKFPLLAAEGLDHNANYVDDIKPEETPAYGAYLATICMGCHGSNLKGGPGHGPGEPNIPDLTLTGNLGKWNSTQFVTALQTGKTPDGRILSDFMPWKSFGKAHNELELKAIYLFLHELK